jgi:hypothetical protein
MNVVCVGLVGGLYAVVLVAACQAIKTGNTFVATAAECAIVVGLVFLLSCALPSPLPLPKPLAPRAATVLVARTPEATYQCSVKAISALGQVAQLQTDASSRVVSFQWHNAVNMVVRVEPDAHGAVVPINGAVAPNKLTVGEFTEVEDLAGVLKERCS